MAYCVIPHSSSGDLREEAAHFKSPGLIKMGEELQLGSELGWAVETLQAKYLHIKHTVLWCTI